MKKVLLMTVVLMSCAGSAMADYISVFTDPGGGSCALGTLAPAPGVNAFYIIHKFNADGAAASQFKVNDTTTLFATSQTTTFLSIGTWNTDLSLAYGGCLTGDIALMTLNFLWFGSPITGCASFLEIAPAPTSPLPGDVATVECDFETLTPANGGRAFVTTDGLALQCCPFAAEESTWGGIKALYR